ncbi:hypothetical protein ACP70R_037600 [Stipagrostis hirtigluma subsp. patula]
MAAATAATAAALRLRLSLLSGGCAIPIPSPALRTLPSIYPVPLRRRRRRRGALRCNASSSPSPPPSPEKEAEPVTVQLRSPASTSASSSSPRAGRRKQKSCRLFKELKTALWDYNLKFGTILNDPDMAPFRASPEFKELQEEALRGGEDIGSGFRRDLKLISEVQAPSVVSGGSFMWL